MYTNQGNLIRAMRQNKGMTLKALALAIGLKDAQYVCGMESGRAGIPAKKLFIISNVLGIPLNSAIQASALDHIEKVRRIAEKDQAKYLAKEAKAIKGRK